ncbi:MAG TPA: methyltransferase domain-containing protein [Pyrinomonadaceae bacterium]
MTIKSYKSRLAASFDSRVDYDDDYTVKRAMLLLEFAELKAGDSVLDIATGTGIVAIAAANLVGPQGKVTGVDISPGMLDQARDKVSSSGLQNVELLEADIERVDFAMEGLDVVLCSSALMWLSDIPAVLKRCRTWLKPDGLLAFSCYTESSFKIPLVVKACARFGISLPNCNEPLGSPERCRSLLRAADFTKIEIQTEQFSKYLPRDDHWWQWNGNTNWLDPRGNPLKELSAEQRREIRKAYEAEVDALETEQGYWHEITMFLVSARK